MNWCPECLARSRGGFIPAPSAALTLPREDLLRQVEAGRHARDLIWAGFRPAYFAQGVPARHAVNHFTGVALDGITLDRGVPSEPDVESIDMNQTETQVWVPRWVWVVRDALRDVTIDDGARRDQDRWLLDLEDQPELRDALCSAYDLGGRGGARALLAPGGPPRRRGSRWAALR